MERITLLVTACSSCTKDHEITFLHNRIGNEYPWQGHCVFTKRTVLMKYVKGEPYTKEHPQHGGIMEFPER